MTIEIIEGSPSTHITIHCPEITPEIRKLEALLYSHEKKLSCTKDGTTFLIHANDVLYFESVDKQTFLYTEADIYELPQKLYMLEEMLADSGFIRSAKSQILNTYKIASLCPDFGGRIEAVMAGGEKLIVSRQYAKQLKERLGLR